MSIRDMEGKALDFIKVNTIMVSVSDKSGLDELIPGLWELNNDLLILSTGGTFDYLKKVLGDARSGRLTQVGDYTEIPEMSGGLVKILNNKIFAGLLGERTNPDHQDYLRKLGGGVYIDVAIGNFYPFSEMIRKVEKGEIDPKTKLPYTFESARGNIDVGGPASMRAAAKNFPSCTAVCDPNDYNRVLSHIREHNGATSFEMRMSLMPKVFDRTAQYDRQIADYMADQVKNHGREVMARYGIGR
jgi:phosphoribosylaminoimidazolecarboxamide formyltransferase / IMP cyclohydrolase